MVAIKNSFTGSQGLQNIAEIHRRWKMTLSWKEAYQNIWLRVKYCLDYRIQRTHHDISWYITSQNVWGISRLSKKRLAVGNNILWFLTVPMITHGFIVNFRNAGSSDLAKPCGASERLVPPMRPCTQLLRNVAGAGAIFFDTEPGRDVYRNSEFSILFPWKMVMFQGVL